jgi:hypothetical protein
MDTFDITIAMVALGGAAWLLGYRTGAKQWKTKFHTLSELSLKLVQLIEKESAERAASSEETK